MTYDSDTELGWFAGRRVGDPVGFYPQPWDERHWNWNNTATSLAICQRYTKLDPAQRRIHDIEALSAPQHLRRLMPAATRALHADPQFVATAQALLDHLESNQTITTIEQQAARIARLGVKRPPMTTEHALEQVIATGSDDVREYAKQVLTKIRGT